MTRYDLRVDYDKGLYLAGEVSLFMRPSSFKGDGTQRGIIFCHGSGGAAYTAYDPGNTGGDASTIPLMRAIVAEGYPILSCDLGGAKTWANATTVSAIGSAVTYLGTLGCKTDKIGFIGESMGHAGAMEWAAANLSQVAAVAALLGVCDTNDVYTNGSGFVSDMNTAWGGTWTNTLSSNPQLQAAAGAYAGLPWRHWGGSSDTTVLPATVTAMANSIGATASRYSIAGGTHSWATYGAVPVADVVAFLKAHV